MTVITGKTSGTALEGTDTLSRMLALAADFTAVAERLASGEPFEIPGQPLFQLTVPSGLDREQKLAWLHRVACGWGVQVVPDGMGGHLAEKRFGALSFVAVVCHPDRSVSGYKSRAALRPAVMGSGAAA